MFYVEEFEINLHSSINYEYSIKNIDAIRYVPSNKIKNISILAKKSFTLILSYKIIDNLFN